MNISAIYTHAPVWALRICLTAILYHIMNPTTYTTCGMDGNLKAPHKLARFFFFHGMTIILSERKKYTNYYIGTMENGIL